jgi:polar amino acid transport system permease protein
MFFIFFGLPSVGLRLSALQAAALAMVINLAAYAIEIIRAGLEAVPAGQSEAARSMGLHALAVFGLIVLPQALTNVYPALVGQITITMLESAVVSQIAVVDLTHVADLIQSRNFRSFETYLVITAIYLLLAVLLRRLLALAGRGLFAGRAP